tara:strand:+ start:205 stop:426 length:222 start_codon:yes stop_codon:yes gene_type:complete
MTIFRESIKRELRNARRIIANPKMFKPSLIETAWLVIKSANRHRIFLDSTPYEKTCHAYERQKSEKPLYLVKG